MATETMNYGYPKPGEDDFYDISQFNQALDMIDQDMKEMDEEKQNKLGIGTFKDNIDILGEGGLPKTNSVCWCRAKVLRGTLPYESQDDYWFTLETNTASENQASSERSQRAVVYGEDNIRIFERLFTGGEWCSWKELLRSDGDTKDNIVTFHSGDMESPTGWAEIAPVESGEKHSSLWRKFSLGIKNLRYLRKLLGATDISNIADGTLTGAVSMLNTGISTLGNRYMRVSVPANSQRKLTFIGFFSVILSFIGQDAFTQGTFIAQGYGNYYHNAERVKVATIQAGSNISCTPVEGEQAVQIKNGTANGYLVILMLEGALPQITV